MPGKAIFGKLDNGMPKIVVPFTVTFISVSLKTQFLSQAKAFLATLARVTRADAPCSVQILGEQF
ncbi:MULTISPECIES: hypothetical protein [unclassified Bradyrhizobium]|uniref:hypothetical protein n=1 Tax=unclassified Bradyrhizobium TaxID=2631580 RepID=UPI0024795AE0|nr:MULTISPECIES: hypothetical protein [unclassified Bradyrhizobium]WGS23203.1 hypothetical protein MTX22_17135 [Bradyrhizobium sp. ISRA463]WGS30211.1 hypothetical protein MTX19_14870 [Bradyrhizobium sp. ISRA464]